MNPPPTKPGFYWAKWRIAEDGSQTALRDDPPSDRWEPVEVSMWSGELSASVLGEPVYQSLENFVWGEPLASTDEVAQLRQHLADADAVIATFCEFGEDAGYCTGAFMDRVTESQARHAEREKDKPYDWSEKREPS